MKIKIQPTIGHSGVVLNYSMPEFEDAYLCASVGEIIGFNRNTTVLFVSGVKRRGYIQVDLTYKGDVLGLGNTHWHLPSKFDTENFINVFLFSEKTLDNILAQIPQLKGKNRKVAPISIWIRPVTSSKGISK